MGEEADRAQEAFERHAWTDVHALLSGATELAADDLDRLAVASYLIGRDRDSALAFERAHAEHIRSGDRERAARSAFWLAVTLMLQGEMAQASGWLARAGRLADEIGSSPLRGLLAVPAFLGALDAGDIATADQLSSEMLHATEGVDDGDLRALALLSRGQALLVRREADTAMRLFDEAMVAVTTGEVSPIPAGLVYCAVIDACMQVCEMRRAASWTDALARWCDTQQGLVPYRGQCLVHRSQVLQARGAWAEAMSEVERARERLSNPPHPALGMALYQQGELHRVRGELLEAERAYRAANGHGRDPTPGLTLLRLAEGNIDAAVAMTRRMLVDTTAQLDRPVVLSAAVEVLLAANDLDAAQPAVDELVELAAQVDTPVVRALADVAWGRVRLAADDPTSALGALRRAGATWRDAGMAYDEARARVQVAMACGALGDGETCALELDAARSTFARLGAVRDVAGVDGLLGAAPGRAVPLTDRECEVLRLVASGRTNREIAAALVLSEHTVARHLQNIFTKLGVTSRSAATAYAYEHDLVRGS